jgi:hypothetical protein
VTAKWERQLAALLSAPVTFEDRAQMERYLRKYPTALPLLEPGVQVVCREFPAPDEVIVAVDRDPELTDPCLLIVVRVPGDLDAARDRDARLAALRNLSAFRKPAARKVLLLTTDNALPGASLRTVQRFQEAT